jgi:hypothetical protein
LFEVLQLEQIADGSDKTTIARREKTTASLFSDRGDNKTQT